MVKRIITIIIIISVIIINSSIRIRLVLLQILC